MCTIFQFGGSVGVTAELRTQTERLIQLKRVGPGDTCLIACSRYGIHKPSGGTLVLNVQCSYHYQSLQNKKQAMQVLQEVQKRRMAHAARVL